MRSLGRVEHFVTGAVGEPGSRRFFIEIRTDDGLEWFALEKQQAAAMAQRSLEILREMGIPVAKPGPDLLEPIEPTFRVGEIGIGADGESVVMMLTPTDENQESVTFLVSTETLGAMAARTADVVAAGRPPCRFCGRPKDAEGHVCPTTNGDLRRRP